MTRFSRRSFLGLTLTLPVVAAATRARAATHEVTISGFAFSPATLEVAVGDTVVFTNQDGAPHTATGDAFDTGRLNKGESGSVTISEAGSHSYKCNFHPAMTGTITAA